MQTLESRRYLLYVRRQKQMTRQSIWKLNVREKSRTLLLFDKWIVQCIENLSQSWRSQPSIWQFTLYVQLGHFFKQITTCNSFNNSLTHHLPILDEELVILTKICSSVNGCYGNYKSVKVKEKVFFFLDL